MEEDKAAAYYEELTRKGEGAAKFKQGLGFTSISSSTTNTGVSSSSAQFFSSFVKASSNYEQVVDINDDDKRTKLESIQNKLKKKQSINGHSSLRGYRGGDSEIRRSRSREWEREKRRRSRSGERESRRRSRSPSPRDRRSREKERDSRRRSNSRSLSLRDRRSRREGSRDGRRSRSSDRERARGTRRKSRSRERESRMSLSPSEHKSRIIQCRRSRSSSSSDRGLRKRYSRRRRNRSSSPRERRERERENRRRRSRSPRDRRERERQSRRSRSLSPRERRRAEERSRRHMKEGRKDNIDYSRLIQGYNEMTAAEKVKAKMKLQLSQTVEKDAAKGMGAGWERFEFNKDAPLDDEEIEAAEDDSVVVKNMDQSFRFAAVEKRRKEQINSAHDEAMFGTSTALPPIQSNKKFTVEDYNRKEIRNTMFGSPTSQSPIQSDEEPVIVEERVKDEEDTNKNVSDARDNGKDMNENSFGANLISDKVLIKQQGSWRDRARKLQSR